MKIALPWYIHRYTHYRYSLSQISIDIERSIAGRAMLLSYPNVHWAVYAEIHDSPSATGIVDDIGDAMHTVDEKLREKGWYLL